MKLWNKPVEHRQDIFVSRRLKRFLSRKSVNQKAVIKGWLNVIDTAVKATILANINSPAKEMIVQPIQLAGNIVAAAYCQRREELDVLEYNIHIAYVGETGMKHPSFWEVISLDENNEA